MPSRLVNKIGNTRPMLTISPAAIANATPAAPKPLASGAARATAIIVCVTWPIACCFGISA